MGIRVPAGTKLRTRVRALLVLALAGGCIGVGASQASAGPAPNLGGASARTTARQYLIGLIQRTGSVGGHLGVCARVTRSRVSCRATTTPTSDGITCSFTIVVFNTPTNTGGYYFTRSRASGVSCKAPPTPTPAPTPVVPVTPTVPTVPVVPTVPAAPPLTCGAPPNPFGYNFCGGALI